MRYSTFQQQQQRMHFRNMSRKHPWIIKICFKKVPGIFLTLLGALLSPKINNIGCWGSGHVQESRNHGFVESGAFKIMRAGFYYTNPKRINSRKLLEVLFKHIPTINDTKNTISIPIVSYDFPIIFLWFSDATRFLGEGKSSVGIWRSTRNCFLEFSLSDNPNHLQFYDFCEILEMLMT